jgi:hypothetical protein
MSRLMLAGLVLLALTGCTVPTAPDQAGSQAPSSLEIVGGGNQGTNPLYKS